LFFISRRLLGTAIDVREWRLVSVALLQTMASYPSCLKDGRYIVDFYISHPSDFRFNAINQRFWVQYHTHDDLTGPCTSSSTHLVKPSDSSSAYAKRNNILPFWQIINLTHTDTYIHGPFDFGTFNGRKSRNRICQADWDVLGSKTSMFHNPLPPSDVPAYSIHVDACAHTSFFDLRLSKEVCSLARQEGPPSDISLYS